MSQRLVGAASRFLDQRLSRRGLLVRMAVAGSALAVHPVRYVARPGTAYASVCGPGTGCDLGWTAMCCTVNEGRNQCPPGSIPAGWWKADSSSFCCGGARYYIDCNATCDCGCAAGDRFCDGPCAGCGCRCTEGTCDERRTCCNVFRYGQCHQEVACVGPIVCRVVSCTPPWLFEDSCGTTTLVDNRTAEHSAPCLAGPCASPVEQKWFDLGGEGGVLGPPLGPEEGTADGRGRFRRYVGGSIWWTPATGASEVHGDIGRAWVALGADVSPLGLPVTDERGTPDGVGRYNHFERGSVYWTPTTGAHEVHGQIHARWASLGWEAGLLGYPLTDELTAPDGVGRYSTFERGELWWSPGTGAHELHGEIRLAWSALGGVDGLPGYPLTDEEPAQDGRGRVQRFERVGMWWTAATGAHEVHGAIEARYRALGAEVGPLGYPVTDEVPVGDGPGRASDFERGSISWAPDLGAVEVRGDIHARWVELGREGGRLRHPVAPAAPVVGGEGQVFQGGHVYRADGGNAAVLYGPILAAWLDLGGPGSDLGLPVGDVEEVPEGRRVRFQHGTLVWDESTGRVRRR